MQWTPSQFRRLPECHLKAAGEILLGPQVPGAVFSLLSEGTLGSSDCLFHHTDLRAGHIPLTSVRMARPCRLPEVLQAWQS